MKLLRSGINMKLLRFGINMKLLRSGINMKLLRFVSDVGLHDPDGSRFTMKLASTCVPIPKPNLAHVDPRNDKILCPWCMRSRRPPLETILSLLMSLPEVTGEVT
ncbi:hypothetical protein JTE90_027095 [Oedothorax gibbosus]|uniref:Uncharacterized protein n=1 Tax=Oedothorax gibbosus TaxID=931172 RepID=A0AAV6TH01_9ARAC|nr:hypothetical protein JTE90_027095 [Oedothorax gibbosus]